METAPLLVTAVDHQSLRVAFEAFLDELRDERGCGGHRASRARTPSAELIQRLAAGRTMRLGVMVGTRLIAVASVDNDGGVALAVVSDHRRRGIAIDLMVVVRARAAAIGYPPLRRYSASRDRLAG
jgi:GNAT superfamily N-acetyltransferase